MRKILLIIKLMLTSQLVSVTLDSFQLYSGNINFLSEILSKIYELGDTVTVSNLNLRGFEYKILGENISNIDKDILCDLIKKTNNDINFSSNKIRFIQESIRRLEILYAKPYLFDLYGNDFSHDNSTFISRFDNKTFNDGEKPRFSDMILEAHKKMYAHHRNILSHIENVD